MKRIGIIGGMSYESTLHYYEAINRQVNERAGDLTSADLVLRSVNFEEYYTLMEKGDWETIGSMLQEEAANLVIYNECDYVAIATNTMHKVADKVSRIYISDDGYMSIRLIHIGDCIGEKCKEINAKRVLLLGTRFTMTEKFMKKYLSGRYGIEVMGVRQFPREVDIIDHIIFDELCCGIVTPRSKEFIKDFVTKFTSGEVAHGFKPDAVILGCTELNMILQPEDVCVPLIDSTQVHIDKLVDLCLKE